MKEIIINHFLDYEFVYIFLFSSIIFLLISIFIKHQIIRKVSILFFSMFFILFTFEFGLSFSVDKIKSDYCPDFYFESSDIQVKKTHEMKIKSKMDEKTITTRADIKSDDYDTSIYKKLYDVIYSQYNNGFRYTKRNENSTETYIFLGCSFVFGDGLNDDETLSYYFSKKFNFEKNILNCAERGHSTNMALNILNNEIFVPFINKNSSIKHFFYSLIYDHISRNFRILSNAPSDCFILKDKKYIINNKIVRLKFLLARSCIFRKIFLPIIDEKLERYYEDYLIEGLGEMNKVIEEKYNSKLTIIVWPEFEKFPLTTKTFITRLKQKNLDLIFLPEKFFLMEDGYRIKDDGHPNAKANEEIAQILYDYINNLEKGNINGKNNNS